MKKRMLGLVALLLMIGSTSVVMAKKKGRPPKPSDQTVSIAPWNNRKLLESLGMPQLFGNEQKFKEYVVESGAYIIHGGEIPVPTTPALQAWLGYEREQRKKGSAVARIEEEMNKIREQL